MSKFHFFIWIPPAYSMAASFAQPRHPSDPQPLLSLAARSDICMDPVRSQWPSGSAEHDCAAGGSLGCIGEQEILAVNDKGLNTPFCPVVGDLQPAIVQVIGQVGPLFFQVSKCLAHENAPVSRIVYASRIYYPLLYGSIVSYRRAHHKSPLILTLTSLSVSYHVQHTTI